MPRPWTHPLLVSLAFAAIVPSAALAQHDVPSPVGGPFTGPTVAAAPFSADATAVLTERRADGSLREHRLQSRYYRDSAGRVRVEQILEVSRSQAETDPPHMMVAIQPEPTRSFVFVLDPLSHTYRRTGRSMLGMQIGGLQFAIPVAPFHYQILQLQDWRAADWGMLDHTINLIEQPLGERVLGGVATTGRSLAASVPASPHPIDGSVDVVEERWESPDLRLLVAASASDPRSGVFQYWLTNIRQAEPPAQLFIVPPDYTERPTTQDEPWSFRWDSAWFKGAIRKSGEPSR